MIKKPKLSSVHSHGDMIISTTLDDLKNRGYRHWEKMRTKRQLDLFHQVSQHVPAYAKFLAAHKIDSKKILTAKDLLTLPKITKGNYLRTNSPSSLLWNGTLGNQMTYTATSGSTGAPFYFPRTKVLEYQNSVIQELFLSQSKNSCGPTLVIVCFGMGVWIGGLITYNGFRIAGERGYPVSLLTTGINKDEIFKALREISPQFSQTVLCGYPPFIKDIIDEAPGEGINLGKLSLRISFAAEPFTDGLRSHISKAVKMRDETLDTMNIYGSADLGALAFETPLSTQIRKLAVKNRRLFVELFGNISKTPTLTQFIPDFVNFEEENGELLVSGNSALPLVRYAIGDNGGVISYADMQKRLLRAGYPLQSIVKKFPAIKPFRYELPFVYVYERNDLSTTLYGLQIYPETIKEVLLKKPFTELLTGKFSLVTKFNKRHDQYLEVNLELRKGQKATFEFGTSLLDGIIKNLLKKNAEFRELTSHLKDRTQPKLIFWPHEDSLYFKSGIKQQWIKK